MTIFVSILLVITSIVFAVFVTSQYYKHNKLKKNYIKVFERTEAFPASLIEHELYDIARLFLYKVSYSTSNDSVVYTYLADCDNIPGNNADRVIVNYNNLNFKDGFSVDVVSGKVKLFSELPTDVNELFLIAELCDNLCEMYKEA